MSLISTGELRRHMARASIAVLLAAAVACTARDVQPSADRSATMNQTLNEAGEAYVHLVLAMGVHDEDYVDAYFGPEEWKTRADSARIPVDSIRARAAALGERLAAVPRNELGAMEQLRHDFLVTHVRAIGARIDVLEGRRLPFDEESRLLYDAVAPHHAEEHFQRLLARLDSALPGTGPVHERYADFRAQFTIPRARLDTVFRAAVNACRERTLQHVSLPAEESFTIEYVTDKPWSGYNWYQGDFRSLIQVNTDLPIFIDRALDLACHEGYPGHHAFNVLREQRLVRERNWPEYTVYALFSPASLIAEGSANYGVELAFPGGQRARFERDSLFPLAGLDPSRAEEFYRIFDLAKELSFAGNEAARRYLDGEIDAAAAADWLNRYGLMEPARAQQRVRFIDRYRSYVINYNLGEEMVRQYVERVAGDDQAARWRVFMELISSPRVASAIE